MVGMMKRTIFLLVLLVSIVSATALDFDLSTTKIKDKISLNDVAEFDLSIKNNDPVENSYRIKTLDYPIWDVYTKPLQNPIIVDILPNQTKTIRLLVDPLHVISIGTFDVNVRVSLEGQKVSQVVPLRVSVASTDPLVSGYVPTVLVTVDMPNRIEPNKEIPIKLNIDNQNPLDFPSLLITLNGNTINEEVTTSLGPKEKKTIEIKTQISPKTPPQIDNLVLAVFDGDITIVNPMTKKIEIVGYSQLSEEERLLKNFLRKEKEIVFTNVGNVKHEGIIEVNNTFFKGLFTSTRPKAIKSNEKLSWVVTIEPSQSFSVMIVENYLPLLIILVFLVVIVMLYIMYRSPLTLSKTATNIAKKEGGISELKVIITVKNRSKSSLKEIEIIDKIPNITDIERELTIGTLQPTKILKHEKKGSIIKWMIDDLGVGDERVISYRIKSALSILGDFNLPSSTAKFKYKGREVKASSNSLNISC